MGSFSTKGKLLVVDQMAVARRKATDQPIDPLDRIARQKLRILRRRSEGDRDKPLEPEVANAIVGVLEFRANLYARYTTDEELRRVTAECTRLAAILAAVQTRLKV